MIQDLEPTDWVDYNTQNWVRIVRKMSRLLTQTIAKRLENTPHNVLNPSHLHIFEYLDLEGTSIVVLAQRSGVSKQAMSKFVREVSEEGYIRIDADPTDSRANRVVFTEKGIKFLLEMQQAIQMLTDDLLKTKLVKPSEMTTTIRTLSRMNQFLETQTED